MVMLQPGVSRDRFVLLFGCGLLSMFGSNAVEFSGAGALGVLTMATIAAYGWGNDGKVRRSYFCKILHFCSIIIILITLTVECFYVQYKPRVVSLL